MTSPSRQIDRALQFMTRISYIAMALFYILTISLIAYVHGSTTALTAAVIMTAIHVYYRLTP